MSINEKMTAIADNIRNKTGETKALTLDDMASGVDDVFEAGKREQNEDFWREYQFGMYPETWYVGQSYYMRNNYAFAGAKWNARTFYPMFDIIPVNAPGLFYYFNLSQEPNPTMDLSERLKECGVVLDTSNMASMNYVFNYANVDNIPTIDVRRGAALAYTFANCTATKIQELIVKDTNTYTSTFSSASNLVDIKITGTIGKNGFNMSSCTSLSASSILSVLKACNKASANISITLPKKCINKNTDTLSLIEGDSELYSAYTAALENSYTVTFA